MEDAATDDTVAGRPAQPPRSRQTTRNTLGSLLGTAIRRGETLRERVGVRTPPTLTGPSRMAGPPDDARILSQPGAGGGTPVGWAVARVQELNGFEPLQPNGAVGRVVQEECWRPQSAPRPRLVQYGSGAQVIGRGMRRPPSWWLLTRTAAGLSRLLLPPRPELVRGQIDHECPPCP
jgi:hypothetical protein